MALTQYEVNHMENLMVRDDYWQDRERDDDWDEEEVFEDDDIDEW